MALDLFSFIFDLFIDISYNASIPQQIQKLQRCRSSSFKSNVNIFNLLQLFKEKPTEIWRMKGEDEFNKKQRKRCVMFVKKRSRKREKEEENSQNKNWSK